MKSGGAVAVSIRRRCPGTPCRHTLWLDVPADQVQVVLDYSRIDPEAVELAAGARSEQARAEELSRGAARRLRQAARRLVHIDGLSLRDAAAVLGVTFGRVQQLLKD
jgi:DNA-directed RNA polymerase specialized sigma24 family protein